MGKTYTQQLSELIVGLKYEDIPESVVEQVKKLTVHTIGAALAASPIKQAQTAVGIVSRKNGTPEATIWGAGKKVPVEDAAYANAVSSSVLDWEDRSWTGHPSAAVIPVALAYAEAKGLTGKEYVEVVVTAYEAYQRIAMGVQPSDERRAEFGSGLMSYQTFAATIAAVKAMGYDAEHINQTFGAAIYSAPIPNTLHLVSDQKSDLYHFAHGSVAHNGVIAAKLGNVGLEGGYDYLEGPHGYWKTITETPDDTWYVKDFGTRWLINEVLLRQWPVTIWAQTPVALLDELVHEHPFTPEDVEKIRYSPVHAQLAGDYAASDKKLMDGQLNLSYVLAVYLYNQTPGAAWYSDAALNDEKVIALAGKVEGFGPNVTSIECDARFKAGGFPEVTVEVTLKDGTVLTKTGNCPKGHPCNPTTLEEEFALFRTMSAGLAPEKAEQLIEAVRSLEILDNAGDIVKNL